MPSVSRDQRHTKQHRCPICGGAEQDPRGQGKRCNGYTSSDGRWVRCSRAELAGSVAPDDEGLYRHMIGGPCNCGTEHAPAPARAPNGGIEAVYEYRDEVGDLLFQVLRKFGKRFSQRRPAPAGSPDEWIYKLEDTRRVLYRLPELVAAPPSQTVYFAEGEKDVEVLRRHGLLATCNPHGAGKWRIVAQHAITVLRGRVVVVVVDKDDPGRKHAAQVARALGARVLELPDRGDRKVKDAADFFAAGGTVEELLALDPVTPAPDEPTPPAPETDDEPARATVGGAVPSWRDLLLYDKKKLRKIPANASLIFANDEQWRDVVGFDLLAQRPVARRVPPWRACDAPAAPAPGDWTDEDTTRAQAWFAAVYGLELGHDAVFASVVLAAHRAPFHPVQDYLDGVRWDGTMRASTWLIDLLGAEDTPYVREVSRAFLVSAVARAYKPGCKVDTVPILESEDQGVGKSSVLRALVGDAWHLELSIRNVADKDAMQCLRRRWIAELPEIDGLSKNDAADVKAFVSRQVDTYRPPYAREARDFPRSVVFVGTTNSDAYLRDETGARRFWPVKVSPGNPTERAARAAELRDQLWAEARARFESAESWHVADPELLESFRLEADARRSTDPWTPRVAAWLAQPSSTGFAGRPEFGVLPSDVLGDALEIEVGRWTKPDEQRVTAILRDLGWRRGPKQRHNGARVRLWRPAGAYANGYSGVAAHREPTPFELAAADAADLDAALP